MSRLGLRTGEIRDPLFPVGQQSETPSLSLPVSGMFYSFRLLNGSLFGCSLICEDSLIVICDLLLP